MNDQLPSESPSTSERLLNWYSNNIGSRLDEMCTCGAISADQVLHDDDLSGSVFATVHGESMFEERLNDPALTFQEQHHTRQRRSRRRGGVEESKAAEDDDGIVAADSPSAIPKMPMYFTSTAIGMSSMQRDDTMRTIASIHRKDTMPAGNTALGKIERALDAVTLRPRPRDMNDSSLGIQRIRLASPVLNDDSLRDASPAVTAAEGVSNIPSRPNDMNDSSLGVRRIRLATPVVSKSQRFNSTRTGNSQRESAPASAYFLNVPCFRSTDLHPPISPADTCTTVSLSNSFDTSLCHDLDDEDEDMDATCSTAVSSTDIASDCFRTTGSRSTKNTKKDSDTKALPMMPDPSNESSSSHSPFMLHMKPQKYFPSPEKVSGF